MTKPTKQTEGENPFDDEARSIPLSFEESAESITVAPGAARRRYGFGTMAFASVAVVAIVSLFSMRAIGHATASTDAPTDAGKMVDEFLLRGPVNTSVNPLGQDPLFMDAMTVRIERDELTKDPFVFIGEELAIAPTDPVTGVRETVAEDPAARRALRLEGWNAVVDAGAADLHAQSVLVTSRAASSIANVNGKVLVIGSLIASQSTGIQYSVAAIAADGVTFRAFDVELGCERFIKVLVKRDSK